MGKQQAQNIFHQLFLQLQLNCDCKFENSKQKKILHTILPPVGYLSFIKKYNRRIFLLYIFCFIICHGFCNV
jgi:hypothetical protein